MFKNVRIDTVPFLLVFFGESGANVVFLLAVDVILVLSSVNIAA